jgi:acyl carrier protein
MKNTTEMTRLEIASAVNQIVAAVADEHGLVEARDAVTLRSSLHDDLGMDEVDLIEVLFRAEEQFGVVLPDNDIGLSSTVSDIVDLVAARLKEQEAPLRLPQVINAARENAPEVGQPECVIGADQAPSIAEFKNMPMVH